MDNAFFSLVPGAEEYPPLQQEIAALDGSDAYDEKQHYLDYIDRFADIIDDPNSVSAAMRSYLLTEGGSWSMEGLPLGPRHLLYWLDQKLKTKARDEHELYADRLSEATGWGVAAPDNRADADPLDLWTTLNALGCNVMIVDVDAVDDGDSSSNDGPVAIPRGATNCTRLDETTAKSASGGAKLTATSDTLYRYQLIGGGGLNYLHESSGSNIRFPLSATRPAIWLIRNTVTDHIVKTENIIGITTPGQQQCPYVLLRGYPGEWPEIWCGNSTDNDASPTECPNASLSPTNGTTAIWYVGYAPTKLRDNVHFRNIWFHSKRETAGGDFIYADQLFYLGAGDVASFRFCQFTDSNPIIPGDPNDGTFPDIVDFGYPARSGTPLNNIIYGRRNNILFDSNFVEPVAVADWPEDSRTTVTHVGQPKALDFGDGAAITGCRFTRNTVRGVKTIIACQFHGSIGTYVAHNDVSTRYTEAITGFLVTDMIVEYNRVHHMGDADRSTFSGDGISFQNSENCIARYNVIYNVEPQLANSYGLSVFASGNSGTPQMVGIQCYGNLLYRMQFHVDDNDQDVVPEDCVISGNLFCGMAEAAKGTRNDAPLVVETNNSGLLDYSLEVSGNNFWRFADGTPGQTTIESGAHMRIYDSASTSDSFDADDVIDNFTDNTKLNPKFASTTEAENNGDFTFASDSPFVNFFPANMPLKQSQSRAWTPD